MDTAIAAGQFATLVRALQVAGLVETLAGPGPFTVFAPPDAAFAKVPTDTLNAILADRSRLTAVLTYHVAPGRFPAAQLATQPSVTTVQGEPIRVAVQGGTVILNGDARVVQADVSATNGLIHVLDTVLTPPAGAGPPANPEVARDGQTLADQPQSVQQAFRSTWGDRAATRWVEEHNAELARAGR